MRQHMSLCHTRLLFHGAARAGAASLARRRGSGALCSCRSFRSWTTEINASFGSKWWPSSRRSGLAEAARRSRMDGVHIHFRGIPLLPLTGLMDTTGKTRIDQHPGQFSVR